MGGKFPNDYNDRSSPLNSSQNHEANEPNDINNGKTALSDDEGKANDDQPQLDDQSDQTGTKGTVGPTNDKNSQAPNQPQSDRLSRLSSSSLGTANSYDQQPNYDKVKDKRDGSPANVNLSQKEYAGMDDEFAPLDLTKTSSQSTNDGNSEKAIELLQNLHKRINDNYQLHQQQQLLQQQFDGQLAAAVAQRYFGQPGSSIGNSSGSLNCNENGASGAGLVGANAIDEAADGLNAFLRNKSKQDQLMQEMAAVTGQLNQQNANESQLNNVSSLLAGLPFNLPSGFENPYARLQAPTKRRGRPENSARRTMNDMISLNGFFGRKDDLALASASKLCNQILKQSPLSAGLLNRKDQLMPVIGPNDQVMFPCNQCDKTFSKQSSLARHKYEHSGMFGSSRSFWSSLFNYH